MATEVGALMISMQADIARLRRDIDEGKNIVNRGMQDIEKAAQRAGNVLNMLGVGISAGAMVSFVKGTIDMADGLNDVSTQLGVNIRDLAQWKAAAELNGTTAEAVGKGIKKLGEYNKEHADRLKAAGITATDVNGQMLELADIFAAMPEGIARTNLATELFGKTGTELIPMLIQGRAALGQLREENEAYASRVAEFAPVAGEFNDNLDQLKINASAVGMTIANDLMVVLGPLAEDFANATRASDGLSESSTLLQDTLRVLVVLGADVGFIFQQLGANMGASMAAMNAWTSGEFGKGFDILQSRIDDFKQQLKDFNEWEQGTLSGSRSAGWNARRVPPPMSSSPLPRSSAELAARLLNPSSGADAAAKQYDQASKSLTEYLAQLDLQIAKGDKISQGERLAIDVQQKLSAAEQARLAPLLAQIRSKEELIKLAEQEKQLAAGRQYIAELGSTFGRDNAVAAANMQVMPQLDRDLMENLRAVDERARSAGEGIRRMFADQKITPDQYATLMAELTGTIDSQKSAVIGLNQEQRRLNASWEYGARGALQQYLDEATNVAAQVGDMLTGALQNGEEAWLDWAQTGEFSSRRLFDQLERDILRIVYRQGMIKPIEQLLGGGGGGGNDWLGSLVNMGMSYLTGGPASNSVMGIDLSSAGENVFANAKGNAFPGGTGLHDYINTIVSSPTLFKFAKGGAFGLMGEVGPEAVMPLTRDGQGRLGVVAQGGGVPNVVFNVTNHGSSFEASQPRMTPRGVEFEVVVGRMVADQMNRPGTPASRSLDQRGARQPLVQR